MMLLLGLTCGYFKSKNWNILFFTPPLTEFAKKNIRYPNFDKLMEATAEYKA
jgi:hypothetical protein